MGDERRSCNVVETEYAANCTVFVSLAHIHITDTLNNIV